MAERVVLLVQVGGFGGPFRGRQEGFSGTNALFLVHFLGFLYILVTADDFGGVLARRAHARHRFLTIPHPCLFLPPLTKQSAPKKAGVM